MQECIASAFRVLPKYNPQRRRMHTYLTAVMNNRIIDICRRKTADSTDPATIAELMAGKPPESSGLFELYESMYDECSEIIVQRFRNILPDDVINAFDIVYEVKIPAGLRGGRRQVIALIRKEIEAELSYPSAIVLYNAIMFVLRLGITGLLKYANTNNYLHVDNCYMFTNIPEFVVAYAIDDVKLAQHLLKGITIKF